MSQRQRFTREFKLEAVRLLEQSDKPIAELARELGIRRNLLYKWQESLSSKGEAAFPGAGRKRDYEEENARLRQELERVKEERDILKKAAAYFARELK
jgi:transposase